MAENKRHHLTLWLFVYTKPDVFMSIQMKLGLADIAVIPYLDNGMYPDIACFLVVQ